MRSFSLRSTLVLVASLLAFSWTATNLAHAVPASPESNQIAQPDGSTFQALMRGDEFQGWMETAEGYTVVKNVNSGFYEYATQGSGGELISTGIPVAAAGVSRVIAQTLPVKGLRPPRNTALEQYQGEFLNAFGAARASGLAAAAPAQTGIWAPTPVSGPKSILVILVNFQDASLSSGAATYWNNAVLNASGTSVAKYYQDNSFGNISVSPVTHTQSGSPAGVVTVTLAQNHPNSGGNFNYATETAWINSALAAAATNVNFVALDTNGDGTISVDETLIYFILAGYETAAGSGLTPSIWAHAWGGGGVSVSGKYINHWALNGERYNASTQMQMGVIAHEAGHALVGLPDLYDISGNNEGLGIFSLMAGGSWGAKSGEIGGATPSGLDAWSRQYLGWSTPQFPANGATVSFASALSSPGATILLMNGASSTNEYWLVENRPPVGWDAGMARSLGSSWTGGLLIQHIDLNVGSKSANSFNRYVSGAHQGNMVEEPSTATCSLKAVTNPYSASRGCPTILYYAGNSTTFNGGSTPNSNFYSGAASSLGITGISAPGSTMTGTVQTVLNNSATYTLTVNSSGATSVAIGASPNTYAGTTNYSVSGIAAGTSITLTAPAMVGESSFFGWSGCDSASGLTCTVAMNTPVSLLATWIQKTQVGAPIKVDANYGNTCAVIHGGAVVCWGLGDDGQLGNGGTSNSNTPVAVSGLSNAVTVTTGYRHSCAVTSSGSVMCWGLGNYGQLGNGGTDNSNLPVTVSGLNNAIAVSAGLYHTCALTSIGTVRCWGYGNGLLGDGTWNASSTPVTVSNLSNAIQLTVGSQHTCALTSFGTVVCWGAGGNGELGNGGTSISNTPVVVSGLTNAISVSAGDTHTCAVTSNATAVCWGQGNYGQLGNGSVTNSSIPVSVSGMTNAIAVSAGSHHNCALTTIGTAYCWGWGGTYQLGNGSQSNSSVPVAVIGLTKSVELSAGYSHTCALNDSGTVSCWGFGPEGQLGTGGTSIATAPVPVSGLNLSYSRQTISFGTAPVVVTGGTGTVIATATSGLPLRLTSLTPDVCLISANIVTAVATGSCTIAANQAGDINFYSAFQATQSFSIAPLSTYAITATANPVGGGTVSCTPNPVNSGNTSTCTATPATGYTFSAWSGDCTGATCVLNNVVSTKNVTATFTQNTYAITTTSSPTAGGTVICTANPVNYNGTSTCTATPATGYSFSAWSGDCTGATCVLSNVVSTKNVTATFTQNTYAITTTASPSAGGTASCAPNPVNHGSSSTCTATPATGYNFTGWSGDCTGSASCAPSNITAPTSVTATFLADSTTRLTASPGSPLVWTAGQITTLTAQVSGVAGMPTGNVVFKEGTNTLGTIPLTNGVASYIAGIFSLGTHPLTARYEGSAAYRYSDASLSYRVTRTIDTTLSVKTTPNQTQPGESVPVTVIITPLSNGGTLSGVVQVSSDGQTCSITLPATSCTLVFASKGAKRLAADYSGNSLYSASTGSGTHFVGKRTSLTPILMLLLD